MSSDLSSNFLQIKFEMANGSGHKIYRFDGFSLDAEKLMLCSGDREIALPPKVIKTLAVMVEKQGEILSKDELIQSVWNDSVVEESNLSQNLYLLRKSLGKRPDGVPYIETLRRRGYRFTGEASLLNTAPAVPPNPNEPAVSRRYGVERRGNVVALVDWKEAEPLPSAAPAAIVKSPAGPRNAVAAVALAVFVLSAAAGLYWFSGRGETTEGNGELTSVRLTNGLIPLEATISPDGKYFVYHEVDGGLYRMWLQQTGHSTRVEVIPASHRRLLSKTFSPDGQFIYYLSLDVPGDPWSLYRVPTLGGPTKKILNDTSSYVSFSPDGLEMVFYRYNPKKTLNQYIISPSDGGGAERVLYSWDDERTVGGNPAWSPDGKIIAFGERSFQGTSVGHCSLVAIPAKGGLPTPISAEEWGNCGRLEWSQDGGGLYMIGTKMADYEFLRRDIPYYIPYPQGRSRRLTNDQDRHQWYSLGVTKDGSVITVPFNRASQIWVMDPSGDSRSAVQISSGLADGRPGIAPMADGRIAYVTRTGDSLNIWSMNQDGSGQMQLNIAPYFVEEVRSGGGGRYLVFSARQDRFQHLFRMNTDGTDVRQLTSGSSYEIDSSLSHDGKWVAYGSHFFVDDRAEHSLWKTPIEGGEPVYLNRKDCSRPHFSPDDSLLSCITENDKEILIISSDDGSLIRSLTALPHSALNFGARWTPDGKAVVYIDSNDVGISNLWLQPIDGSPPKRLTDFTTGTMYHFAYSVDGSRLFVARGQQIRDAVLIRRSDGTGQEIRARK
jgi:eukaryotic-like serine/threonine-protein kinase